MGSMGCNEYGTYKGLYSKWNKKLGKIYLNNYRWSLQGQPCPCLFLAY